MTAPALTNNDSSAFEAAVHATVVTARMLDAAMTELEIGRARYDDAHRQGTERLARIAAELGRPTAQLRAQLVLADITLRSGVSVEAVETLTTLEAQAQRLGDPYTVARGSFLLSSAQFAIGDIPNAQISGFRSVELLPMDAPKEIRIDHLCALAVGYGPGEESDRRLTESAALAAELGDRHRLLTTYNAFAYHAVLTEDVETAVRYSHKLETTTAEWGMPLNDAQNDTIARTHLLTGDAERAVAALDHLPVQARTIVAGEDPGVRDRRPYILPVGLLTLSMAQRTLGRYEEAQHTLTTSRDIAERRGLREYVARTLEEQARLYATQGKFEAAYRWHVEFHDVLTSLRADEQAARAQLVRAAYEEQDLRRDAEQLREMAMRDALTGLYNRRYLDERLAQLVDQAAQTDAPISAAIVDADFFKRVNDELSHQVGDKVLQTLSALMASQVDAQTQVFGRLGGEEFALLLPSTDAADAVAVCERLRAVVASYEWPTVAGHVPVTVSIGVSTAPHGRTTPSALLSDADHNLYAAKRSGRNRVTGDSL